MSTIEHAVDVNVPIRVAYNQWTQFESFPEFMEGVESIRQVTDTRTHWITEIAGVKREFDAEITEQHPDERVAWRSLERPHQSGVVTFHRISPDASRVTLQMDYEPEGFAEKAGDWLNIVSSRVKGDMERFKKFIESRGGETGAWRGDVPGAHQRDVPGTHQRDVPGAHEGDRPGTHQRDVTGSRRRDGFGTPQHDVPGHQPRRQPGHQPGSGLGDDDRPVPPGTVGGETGYPEEPGTLPPPGTTPGRTEPPHRPGPAL